VRQLEEQLLGADVRRSPAELAALLDDDFVEIGASGRRYDKRGVIAALLAEATPRRATLTEFAAREVAPDVVLATYRVLPEGAPASLRCSLWRRRDDRWQLLFHQGTPVAP